MNTDHTVLLGHGDEKVTMTNRSLGRLLDEVRQAERHGAAEAAVATIRASGQFWLAAAVERVILTRSEE